MNSRTDAGNIDHGDTKGTLNIGILKNIIINYISAEYIYILPIIATISAAATIIAAATTPTTAAVATATFIHSDARAGSPAPWRASG